jgi:DMSO/TMAO reductase YedYZ molybdopterin-dependent catalytic subunit
MAMDRNRSPGPRLRRRQFLAGAAGCCFPVVAAAAAAGGGAPGLIVRETETPNLEFPFSSLEHVLTPNEAFYVRCHFKPPEIDVATWRLAVEGAVDRPLALSAAELPA